jgi:hypothetical protein
VEAKMSKELYEKASYLGRVLRHGYVADAEPFIEEYSVFINGKSYISVDDFIEYLKGNR